MAKSEKILKDVSKLLSDELGKQTGELFYTSYQNKDVTDVIKDARTLLADLVGPEMAMKKIADAGKGKSEK